MKIYNTLTRKKEEFKPIKGNKVGMYVCGPTVYDYGHLGHGRAAVCFDIIRKYLIYKDYEVMFVTNYTDIDDKMIKRAEINKTTVKDLAEKIIPEYQKDYTDLGVMTGDVEPKATESIKEMIELINGLEEKGYTYVLDDGVYYEVEKFKEYGKLSKQKLDELKSGARVEVKEDKRSPHDFVLWKFAKPGEPKYESPWGEGRPGWHIECSAMSAKYLGETFDIHGGGADLIFPHHECEIAQSEAYSGKKFARYWLHNGFIRVNDEKMSKSLGNFFTLKDIFKEFDPQAVRYLFLQTHYRSPIDFSDELLEISAAGLMRLHDFIRRLSNYEPKEYQTKRKDVAIILDEARKKFEEAMDDDFETPRALAACFDLVKQINKLIDSSKLKGEEKESVITFVNKVDTIFGIFYPTKTKDIDERVVDLINEREKARSNKEWKRADEIRDELLKLGIQLEDTAKGTIWKKV